MRDFYKRYDTWLLDRLRRDLPGYVYYRNHIRGHHALGGKPAITRLNEYTHLALPAVLERLLGRSRTGFYTPAEKSWFPWFRFYGPEDALRQELDDAGH